LRIFARSFSAIHALFACDKPFLQLPNESGILSNPE